MRVMICSPWLWDWLWLRPQPVATVLAKRGHEVIFVERLCRRGRPRDECDTHPVPPGVEIVSRAVDLPRGVRLFWEDARQIVSLIKERQPDIVIGYDPVRCLGPVWHCARSRKIRFVLDYIDPWAEFQGNLPMGMAVRHGITPAVAHLASQCICTAEMLARDIRPYSGHVSVIPSGVDLAQFSVQVGRPASWNPSGPVVFVGHFGDFVDYEMLLAAARRLPDVPFELYGDGPCLAPTRAAAAGLANLHFRGSIPHDQVASVLQASLAALIPFRLSPLTDRAFPLKLVEYWAMRRPVISSPIAELKLVAADRLLFASDGEELADRIETLRRSEELATRLAEDGYREVLEMYDIERIMDRYEAVLQQLVG